VEKNPEQFILIQLKCSDTSYKHFWNGVEKKIYEIKKQKRPEVDSKTRQRRGILFLTWDFHLLPSVNQILKK